MQGIIFTPDFTELNMIDMFTSFIWTDRYNVCGDFEIFTQASNELFANLKQGYYIKIKESDRIMVIEDIELNTDYEDGDKIIISGRSFESILEGTIAWSETVLDGNFQTEIKRLLNENVINPTDSSRKIDKFIFKDSTDPLITELQISSQVTGLSLFDIISVLCQVHNIGFKITLSPTNEFVFQLYSGQDRSFDQTTNPFVIFSPEFDNISTTSYFKSNRLKKTVALVKGATKSISVYSDEAATGINRREIFVDASDITDDDILKQKGEEKLAEHQAIETIDGDIEQGLNYIFGEDFYMGDIVQVVTEYGMQTKSRVVEMIYSEELSEGIKTYPTFKSVS